MTDSTNIMNKIINGGKAAVKSDAISIDLDRLESFKDVNGIVNPSPVDESDPEYSSLRENIRKRGLDHPITVRPLSDGKYQILCGHRRAAVFRDLGIPTIKAMVKSDLSDDGAAELVALDNFSRKKNYKPSEKASFYKMALEAIKRQTYQRKYESEEADGRAIEVLSNIVADGTSTIKNYIRLSYLVPEMLNAVDEKKLKLVPAVELSYLKPEEQQLVYSVVFGEDDDELDLPTTIDTQQAKTIRKRAETFSLTKAYLNSVLSHTPRAAKIHLTKDIKNLLPDDVRKSPTATKDFLIKAITFYQEHNAEIEENRNR